jgi:hypothetical protein
LRQELLMKGLPSKVAVLGGCKLPNSAVCGLDRGRVKESVQLLVRVRVDVVLIDIIQGDELGELIRRLDNDYGGLDFLFVRVEELLYVAPLTREIFVLQRFDELLKKVL